MLSVSYWVGVLSISVWSLLGRLSIMEMQDDGIKDASSLLVSIVEAISPAWSGHIETTGGLKSWLGAIGNQFRLT